MKNKVLKTGIILVVLAVAVLAMVGAGAAATTVTDEQGLRDAVAAGGDVTLGADIKLNNGQVEINKTVILDLAGHTLDAQSLSRVIYISSSGNLTLKDTDNNGKITGGKESYGGGVYNGGQFTMESGTISGNTAIDSGGGVCNYGTFTMNGGTISGNTAVWYGGGVCNYGTFTMNEGTISGNTAGYGGSGVYNQYFSTFTMNGGTISGNNMSIYGGGVYNRSFGTFIMNGGTISGNTAEIGGGGVYNGGQFTMDGGAISGNIGDYGGGVANWYGTFTMYNGEISGNIGDYGGGVENDYNGTFTMKDGTISGNTASQGDDVYNEGTFTQEGGTIGSSSETNSSESLMLAAASSATNDSSSASVYNAGEYINTGGKVNGTVFNYGEINIGGTARIEEIYLPKGKEITFLDDDDKLKKGAKIGIRFENPDNPGKFFKGFDKGYIDFIECKNPGYKFEVDENGNIKIKPDSKPTPIQKSSSSSVASFRGEKVGNDFVFDNAVVITKATLPGASSAKITNNGSGDGWYRCILETDGFKGNGVLYFQVPLDVLEVKGWTMNDVSLFGCKTTYLSTDGQYAKYSGIISQDGTYTIGFEKDAASAGTVVTTTEQQKTDDCKLSISGISSLKIGDKVLLKAACSDGHQHVYTWKVSNPNVATIDANGNLSGLNAGSVTVTVTDDDGHSVSKTITVAAKAEPEKQQTTQSPFPILGILAGLGVAAVLIKRRK